jgi:large subunit ribosomal protein L37Ae
MLMAKRTRKVGSAGRLGPRYGVRIRRRIGDIERVSKVKHECPKCKSKAVKRKANGIWNCRHCGSEFASSAYVLTPPVAVKREVAQAIAEAEAKVAGREEEELEREEEEVTPEEESLEKE